MPELQLSTVAEAVFGQPWLLRAEKLTEIGEFLLRRDLGEQIQHGFSASERPDGHPFQVVDRVALIPVFGLLAKRMNLLGRFSGGTSTDLLKRELDAAIADRSIDAIVLDVDSPGGSAMGPFELSDFLHGARNEKPLVAVANEQMASGGYLIASACREIVAQASSPVGSIGVVRVHKEFSKANREHGITVTVFRSGEFKALPSDSEPLTDTAREVVDEEMGQIHDLFVSHVARNRGKSDSYVRENWANGKVWFGREAKRLGLVDRLGTLDETVARLARGEDQVLEPEVSAFETAEEPVDIRINV